MNKDTAVAVKLSFEARLPKLVWLAIPDVSSTQTYSIIQISDFLLRGERRWSGT
jgi:hypothetical protein